MRPRPGAWEAGVLAGVAAGGITLGHVLAYTISVPEQAARHELLVSTGHAYAPATLVLVTAIAAVACAAALGIGLARGLGSGSTRPMIHRSSIRTAAIQTTAFVALESAERIVAGSPLSEFVGIHLFVGVVVQLAVGALLGVLLVALDRTGEILGAAVRRPARPTAPAGVLGRPPMQLTAPTAMSGAPRSSRGPPKLIQI